MSRSGVVPMLVLASNATAQEADPCGFQFQEDALEQSGAFCPELPSRAGLEPGGSFPTEQAICDAAANTLASLEAQGQTPTQATIDSAAACGLPVDSPAPTPAPAPAPAPAPTSTGTEAMPSQSYAVMPDTGGPSLLLPVAALLVGSGLLGFAAVRRIK